MNAQRLRAKMRELKLSAAKLAELSDVSESTIKRALGGAKLTPPTAQLIARALEVEVSWLDASDEPIDEPIEPIDEPEDEDMKAAVEAVMQVYRDRFDEMRAQYLSQIADLKHDKRILAIATAVLMLFIVCLFAYDIFNPSVGWFQY